MENPITASINKKYNTSETTNSKETINLYILDHIMNYLPKNFIKNLCNFKHTIISKYAFRIFFFRLYDLNYNTLINNKFNEFFCTNKKNTPLSVNNLNKNLVVKEHRIKSLQYSSFFICIVSSGVHKLMLYGVNDSRNKKYYIEVIDLYTFLIVDTFVLPKAKSDIEEIKSFVMVKEKITLISVNLFNSNKIYILELKNKRLKLFSYFKIEDDVDYGFLTSCLFPIKIQDNNISLEDMRITISKINSDEARTYNLQGKIEHLFLPINAEVMAIKPFYNPSTTKTLGLKEVKEVKEEEDSSPTNIQTPELIVFCYNKITVCSTLTLQAVKVFKEFHSQNIYFITGLFDESFSLLYAGCNNGNIKIFNYRDTSLMATLRNNVSIIGNMVNWDEEYMITHDHGSNIFFMRKKNEENCNVVTMKEGLVIKEIEEIEEIQIIEKVVVNEKQYLAVYDQQVIKFISFD